MNWKGVLAHILILRPCSDLSEEKDAKTYDQRAPEMMIKVQKRFQALGYDRGLVNG
ncbi:MAG: hypothetical protein HPY30_10740 [Gammaproteobacteria bacterium (ex Lamellibrachia satsuma)]|nr:MAG: hypothetical protein HPY30_10740 [Gammaproteobacteria bacterium (ex Lamellibrachia satsuma)]